MHTRSATRRPYHLHRIHTFINITRMHTFINILHVHRITTNYQFQVYGSPSSHACTYMLYHSHLPVPALPVTFITCTHVYVVSFSLTSSRSASHPRHVHTHTCRMTLTYQFQVCGSPLPFYNGYTNILRMTIITRFKVHRSNSSHTYTYMSYHSHLPVLGLLGVPAILHTDVIGGPPPVGTSHTSAGDRSDSDLYK
jgi:hypothetical protein